MTVLEIEKKVALLSKELTEVRALLYKLIPLDNEGEYTEKFKREISKKPVTKIVGTYTGKGSLLALVHNKKLTK